MYLRLQCNRILCPPTCNWEIVFNVLVCVLFLVFIEHDPGFIMVTKCKEAITGQSYS